MQLPTSLWARARVEIIHRCEHVPGLLEKHQPTGGAFSEYRTSAPSHPTIGALDELHIRVVAGLNNRRIVIKSCSHANTAQEHIALAM